MACRGTTRDKLDAVFKAYDRDCDGYLSREDVESLLRIQHRDQDQLEGILKELFGPLKQLALHQFCRGMVCFLL